MITPTSIKVIPRTLAKLIFSFQINTEIIVVKTRPKPDHTAYAVFKGIVLSDSDKKKKLKTKAMIKPTVGMSFENPADAFNNEVPMSSPTIARNKNRYDNATHLHTEYSIYTRLGC